MVVLAGRPCHQIPSTTPHQLPPTSTALSLPSRHPDLAATARRSGQISTSGRPPREDHPSAAPPRPRTHVPRRIVCVRSRAEAVRERRRGARRRSEGGARVPFPAPVGCDPFIGCRSAKVVDLYYN
nr:uncharacterized protein LOC127317239 [Lolium perenne]